MKLAVWYHCLLSGSGLDSGHLFHLLSEQLGALSESGLDRAAQEFHFGVNGDEIDALVVRHAAPDGSEVIADPSGATELPTLIRLQRWLPRHPGYAVLYFHMKGARYPGNPTWDNWRACMTRACIGQWNECVQALSQGFDTCGAHWLSADRYPIIPPSQRYWGGNFWWATSDYLGTLPPLPADQPGRRYEAEVWIGKGPRAPRVRDFAPHFPMRGCSPS